jgi:predicted ArsR family transcriptional regulator
MSSFEFDEEALQKVVKESDDFKQIQALANARAQQIVREVNTTHSGRPFAEVDRELRSRFDGEGITPEEPGFTEFVREISDGEAQN